MERTAVDRQKLMETVSALPDEALLELASFLDYLRYKSGQPKNSDRNTSSFLLAIAGLGNSGQTDISEQDEEILRSEVDSIYGLNLKSNNHT